MFASLKIHMLELSPQVMQQEIKPLGGDHVVRVQPWWMRWGSYKRARRETLAASAMWWHYNKTGWLWARKLVLTRHRTSLDFSTFRTKRNCSSISKPPVQDVPLQQSKWTKTPRACLCHPGAPSPAEGSSVLSLLLNPTHARQFSYCEISTVSLLSHRLIFCIHGLILRLPVCFVTCFAQRYVFRFTLFPAHHSF